MKPNPCQVPAVVGPYCHHFKLPVVFNKIPAYTVRLTSCDYEIVVNVFETLNKQAVYTMIDEINKRLEEENRIKTSDTLISVADK